MTINYNNYPSLLFLSYDKDTAPQELPFEVISESVQQYLTTCKGYQELFAYVAVCNTITKTNTTTNYLLNDLTFSKIDSEDNFRNKYFGSFFDNYAKQKHGTILFKGGGQYVYMLLDEHETKALKNINGRYICAALFKENIFIGFEEAYITDRGLQVLNTGHYEAGMDRGGYLSFVLITLAYADSRTGFELYKSDNIKEKIYLL